MISTPPVPAAPSQPPLVFRVGVVGHRPERLRMADPAALRALLADLLRQTRAAVEDFARTPTVGLAPGAPVLRAVSPLAEGTDRLFAAAALELGYALCCPMPFHQEDYESSFRGGEAQEPDSVQTFRGLLARADAQGGLTTFELDRARTGDSRVDREAYAAASRLVLAQSDLLVVVWDGEKQDKIGGTEYALHAATAYQVPVIWVDAHAPHAWQFLQSDEISSCLNRTERCVPAAGDPAVRARELAARVRAQLAPPGARADLRACFFAETKPRLNRVHLWQRFREFVCEEPAADIPFEVPEFEPAIAAEWPLPGDTGAPGDSVAAWVNARLRRFFAWPDGLSNCYAGAYRSAFVLAYFLGALAVGFALLPVGLGIHGLPSRWESVFVVSELAAILAILAIVWRGRRGRWHDRWVEYRIVAELLRQLRLLLPLGGGPPQMRPSGHLRNYDPADTWMLWHVRAISRAVGLPRARLDPAHLEQCRAQVAAAVAGQIAYHQKNHHRMERLAHRLHTTGLWFLGLTIASIVLHLLHWPHGAGGWLTLTCAWFPALGAALAGISNQGEFARVAKRSAAMVDQLAPLHAALAALAAPAGPLTSAQLEPLAVRASRLMVDEVLDWRVVFLDRPLVHPA